ncbi:hypothetical protein CYD30_29255, partial [Kosakonia cowanii]
PDNLTVGGSLYLDPEKIVNVSYRENCGHSSRTIFAVYTNKTFRIAAGCFFGSIEQFEQAVDNRYDGDAAEAYKKAGRDCVAELKTGALNQPGQTAGEEVMKKHYSQHGTHAGYISYATREENTMGHHDKINKLSPREMLDLAVDVATFVEEKTRETGKDISGREVDNILTFAALILPAGSESVR